MVHLRVTPLIEEDQILKRVAEMGATITDKLKPEPVVAICVLKGSFIFYADLIRALDLDVTCEFFGVQSYSATQSTGEVKITLDLSHSVTGKHVLLIEDIVDTGLTMNFLIDYVKKRKPASVTTVALLSKPDALKVPCKVDHVGFQIKNEYVVGYGLDYQGYYRNLPFVARIENFQ